MNFIKDWWAIGIVVIGWLVTATVHWTKTTTKLNGLGGRVKKVEESCSANGGRMDRFEKELSEYRRDAQDSAKGLARVEKGIEDVHETVQQSNLQVGSQLSEIKTLIQKNDKDTSNRLVRIETVQQIEKKVGPIPTGE